MSVKLTGKRMKEPLLFDRPHVMFVEGGDDQAFAVRQIEIHCNPTDWQVHDMNGKDSDWKNVISIALSQDWMSDYGKSITLVRDADADPLAAWQSLRDVFLVNGLPVPTGHAVVAKDARWRTGGFIVPDGTSTGSIEHLIMRSISTDRLEVAEAYVQEISSKFGRPQNPSKNTVTAYLAGHVAHIKTIPAAMNREEVIPREHTSFDEFVVFIKDVTV